MMTIANIAVLILAGIGIVAVLSIAFGFAFTRSDPTVTPPDNTDEAGV